jgi:hypothetical protein
VDPQSVVVILGRDSRGEVVGEGVLSDSNLKWICTTWWNWGFEVEGDGDEDFDALNYRDVSP